MKKQTLRALLCLCLVFPIGAAADDADDESFSNIFAFGNSLSDTGNAAAGINVIALMELGFEINLCHPSDKNPVDPAAMGCGDLFFQETRASNGPVAVEVLAKRLGFEDLGPSLHVLSFVGLRPREFGTNYAVAGAHAVPPDPTDPTDVLPALPTQIQAFLVDHDFAAPSDALYVMFIGGNDVREARDALRLLLLGVEETPRPESIIAAAVSSIDQSIRALIGAQAEMGSGAKTFLVVNSPNIASLPETRIIAETLGPLGPMFVLGTIQLTKQFNQQLAERLDQIRADQMDSLVKIKEFNLFRFFEGVRFVGKLLGVFENIKDACFSSRLYQATGSLVFVPPLGHPDCEPDEENEPPKFDDFVFFDDIHPTGQVHRIVGKALSKAARKLVDDDDDDD